MDTKPKTIIFRHYDSVLDEISSESYKTYEDFIMRALNLGWEFSSSTTPWGFYIPGRSGKANIGLIKGLEDIPMEDIPRALLNPEAYSLLHKDLVRIYLKDRMDNPEPWRAAKSNVVETQR
jgi:hypothetical protein